MKWGVVVGAKQGLGAYVSSVEVGQETGLRSVKQLLISESNW